MRIDVQELTEQFSKLKAWLTQHKEKAGKMNGGIKTFVSETQSSFQGEAGDGMRACMTDLVTPLYAQFEVTEHTLNRAVDTISQKAESYFGTSGIVDSDYLDEWLNQVERIVRDFDHMSDDIDSKVRNINDLISVQTINRDPFQESLYTVKRHVAEIKSHMTEFEAEANRLVSEVNIEVSKLTSMLKEVSRFNGDMSTYKSGSFKFNQSSMRKMSDKEQQFLNNLQKQYGFDERTSKIILEAYLKSRCYVDMLHTTSGAYSELNENDYTAFFSRLMSQVAYPGLAWTALGGGTGLSFVDTMKAMGVDEDDTLHLKSMLILQYSAGKGYNSAITEEGTGQKVVEALEYLKSQGYGSDKEIFNQFCGENGTFTGKGDFGHQMVVTAVCLNVPTGKDSFEADASSWLGDTNGVGIPVTVPGVINHLTIRVGDRGMDNPDYKADLDGYNIATDQQANTNKNFMDITNEYYDKIDQDKQGFGTNKTRASEFLYHKGFYAESKKMPWDPKNYNKSYNEMCKQGLEEIKWSYSQNMYKKDNYPTTEYINFIKSLESNSNNYTE